MFRETAGQKRQLFGLCYVKNWIYQSAIFIINPVRRQSGNQPPR